MDSSTKKKILETTQELMLIKGYAATSLDEICNRAQLSKGAFFHYFKNKEQLASEVLDSFAGQIWQAMSNGRYRQLEDPLQRLYGYIDFLVETLRQDEFPRGCLVAIFSQELSEACPELRASCVRWFSRWATLITDDFEKAQKQYSCTISFSSQSVAEYFIAVLEGSLILARVHQDKSIIVRNLLQFKQYLQMLFSCSDSKQKKSDKSEGDHV